MIRQLPLAVVAKPAGAGCNLDCHYCFYLEKEKLYDVARQQMSHDVLRSYIESFLGASGQVATMVWQGGEPTLRGLDFFRDVVAISSEVKRPGQVVRHALQTNATLIDAHWAKFLAENDFLVGVSIDGPAHLHDAYRVNKAGRPSHAQVIRGWQELNEAGVQCNILCTVHRANMNHPLEVYRYFRDELDATYIQFIPIVENLLGKISERSVDPTAYGEFLAAIFDEWFAYDTKRVSVQDFDSALGALFGRPTVCVHSPRCGNNFALEFNGDTYACDHFVTPQWKLGNITTAEFADLAATPTAVQFATLKPNLAERCRNCEVLPLCWGGCPKDRDAQQHNYLCAGYYRAFTHMLPGLQSLADEISSR